MWNESAFNIKYSGCKIHFIMKKQLSKPILIKWMYWIFLTYWILAFFFLAFLQPSIIILLQRWLLREEAPFLILRLNIFELQTRSSTHGWILVKCPISFIILTKTYFSHTYVFISWKRNHWAKWKVLTLKYEVYFTWLFLYSNSLLLMRNLARLLL